MAKNRPKASGIQSVAVQNRVHRGGYQRIKEGVDDAQRMAELPALICRCGSDFRTLEEALSRQLSESGGEQVD
jgi:hypothetical protein